MKTLQEIYNEMEKNSSMKEKFNEAIENNELGDFLVKLGCENVNEIVLDYYRQRRKTGNELSLDDLGAVSGGSSVGSDEIYTLNRMLQ